MKPVKIYDQQGNRTVGIFEERDGNFTALTLSQTKTFKTFKGADRWVQKYL
jgi:hypothetical protein